LKGPSHIEPHALSTLVFRFKTALLDYMHILMDESVKLSLGIKPEPEARNPKNPSSNPFSPKPDAQWAPAGIES
jgi:hypothetical protein